MLMMRLLLVPVPHYDGFDLFGNWMKLPAAEKLRSFVGTMKRIVSRGWMKPLKPIVNCQGPHDVNGADGPLINSEEFESRCKV